MPKINQLSFEVANLIAAGEVVERPASVVKELLENAIDAGADTVTVEIKRGGVALIRVADNGVGMTEEDLPLAIRRHATSKIAEAADLDSIATLGFRGEALAATAAVSTLTIITKTKDAPIGTVLTAVGGEVQEISEVGCADGTTVTVEELFANVPARRKFLKKDVTETAAVTAVVEKIAISRPDIALRYITDGTVRFATAGDGVLIHTLHALYGRELASRLLSVSGELGGISVSGFVGRPDNARANRNMQNFFINGRFVKSKTVGAAVERAFTSYMAPERFPVAILFLTLPHFSVDVNVHPAKLEVKFENERTVFEAVYYAVRTALEECVSRPELGLDKRTKAGRDFSLAHSFETPQRAEQIAIPTAPQKETVAPVREEPPVSIPPRPAPAPLRPTPDIPPVSVAARESTRQGATLSAEDSLAICEKYAASAQDQPGSETASTPPAPPAAKTPASPETEAPSMDVSIPPASAEVPQAQPAAERVRVPLPEYRILGTAFRTYVLVELAQDRMLVIDQHAAHERILFERLKAEKEKTGIISTPLLLPIAVEVTATELAYAEEEAESFSRLGFTYTVAEGAVHLLSIPADTTPTEAKDLFLSLCEEGASGASAAISEEKRREKMLYQMACKAAIKGGRTYDEAHVRWLVEEVLTIPDITVCPHGRPIAFALTKRELDRQFDRIK